MIVNKTQAGLIIKELRNSLLPKLETILYSYYNSEHNHSLDHNTDSNGEDDCGSLDINQIKIQAEI